MPPTEESWTIGRLLTWTIDFLGQHEAENPRLDAEVLLSAARRCQRIELYAAYDEEASDELRTRFRELVRQRAQGVPVAYLVGYREFYALEFEVSPDVLIPRPETELLVVALLDYVKQHVGVAAALSIADVGTGSGVLAVCAAKNLPNATVTALDSSAAALAVADRNAERHGVADRIELVESNLLAALPEDRQFDVVLSNPPYVSSAEMEALPRDVRDFEPRAALHGGEQGTEIIGRLLREGAGRLVPGGRLLLEVSPMIADRVESLVRDSGAYELGTTTRDLAGHRRIVHASRLGTGGAA